ncbi:putative transporter MCH4 [Cyphellophora attinorum]|uniref:Putative transporter MCH4 n=1 Tax=Cyphellophora attinorum TaxID=1664694 RepID=A0A0N0NQY4_9EURO|nr:putative transporter MCH4 [Phialophora attinorum]KPI44209.1 putative transporter MCH4 [Phialophora attinorum]
MDTTLTRTVTAKDAEDVPPAFATLSHTDSFVSPVSHSEPAYHPPATEKGLTQTTTTTSQRTAANRVLSRFRTADSIPLTPPPDGGVNAWIMTFMACLVNFNTWGFVNSFGVFQTYYVNTMQIGSPSAVSWIGSVHVFLVFGIGTFSGRATDAGYFHPVFAIGSLIYCVGILSLSFCDQYWQVFLCHSLTVGFGAGLAFVPSIAVAASYFSHAKRGAALALVSLNKCFPAMALHGPCGPYSSSRRPIATVAACVMRPRLPPRRAGPIIEWTALREGPYTLFLISIFFSFCALYVGFFYIGSFGRDVLGVSQATGIQLLLTMNGVGLVARVIPNIIADRATGPLNLIIPYSIITAVVFFSWLAVDSVSGLWTWAVVQGVSNAGIQALFPVVLTSLTDDPKKMGVRSGMGFTTAGMAVLIGPPIAGALVERLDGDYMGLQLFGGCMLALAAAFQIAARWAKVGWGIRRKV